jgi:predicted dehydrogenase
MSAAAAAGRLGSVLVGFGHAGRDLHLPSLARMPERRVLGIVDPLAAAPDPPVPVVPDLAHLRCGDPGEAVVHVCVPPADHAAVIRRAAALGFRRFIVEKPLADTAAGAAEIARLAQRHRLAVVVVANWLFSGLTRAIREELRRAGPPVLLRMRQSKMRITRTLSSRVPETAYVVEMPHMVALALHLLGEDVDLRCAAASDLVVGGRRVATMGSADMWLRVGSVDVHLSSDLASPVRERWVDVTWADGTGVRGYLSGDASELWSQLSWRAADGSVRASCLVTDDTLGRLMLEAYAWFEGRGPRPASDPALHLLVCRLLDEAESAARTGRSPIPLEVDP